MSVCPACGQNVTYCPVCGTQITTPGHAYCSRRNAKGESLCAKVARQRNFRRRHKAMKGQAA